MMSFLKNFLSNEKSIEEQALMAAEKKHDILMIDAGDQAEAAGSCDDQFSSANYGGCCGGGCRQ